MAPKTAAATPDYEPLYDPLYDLRLERIVDVPPALVWRAWTEPEHLVKWFTPKPWQTVDCEIDLRPGGLFRTVMRSPEGEEFPNVGCYLETVEERLLSWTNALGPGFRPAVTEGEGCAGFAFTAIIRLEPHGDGTKYIATALHAKEEDRKSHADMGFEEGWGTALDQLVAVAKEM